jgi:hypothetical protein
MVPHPPSCTVSERCAALKGTQLPFIKIIFFSKRDLSMRSSREQGFIQGLKRAGVARSPICELEWEFESLARSLGSGCFAFAQSPRVCFSKNPLSRFRGVPDGCVHTAPMYPFREIPSFPMPPFSLLPAVWLRRDSSLFPSTSIQHSVVFSLYCSIDERAGEC